MTVKHHAYSPIECTVGIVVVIILKTSISKILFANILTLDAACKSFIGKGENIIEYSIRRKTQMSLSKIVGTPVIEGYCPVFCLVVTESGINIPAKPVDRMPGCF